MIIRQWHWPVAFTIACALHLGLAVLMVLKSHEPPAKGLGQGGLEVQLTQSGSRPAQAAHTRNDVREAARRAAGEAAPIVRANRADQVVAPDQVRNRVATETARDPARPAIAPSPVPESADATEPASAPLPQDLADAQALAAPAASVAAVPNLRVAATPPETIEQQQSSPTRIVTDAAAVESPAVTAVATQAAQESATASNAVSVTAVAAEVAPVAAGGPAPPDGLPPLEAVRNVAPGVAAGVRPVSPVEPAASPVAASPLAIQTADSPPTQSATASDVPIATATEPVTAETAAAGPVAPAAPSTGALQVTRSGDDVTNAGAIGPDESAEALATGRSDEVTARSGFGSGEDRRDSRGGVGGDKKRYISLIEFHFDQHLEYPERAREAGLEGVGILSVTIARDGTILRTVLVQSTGYAVLDEELLAAVERSSPMPPIPDSLSNSRMVLLITRTLPQKD